MSVAYDLVVIGGGSGGLVVTSIAAQLQARVILIEKDRLGGDCLWHGCVPSKSLIHVARVADRVRHAGLWGIDAPIVTIDFGQVMRHVSEVIATIEPHDSADRFRSLGAEVVFGEGQFINRHTFQVGDRLLKARAFVIATGSRPIVPSIPGLRETGFLTNKSFFALSDRPSSLLVIGGGPIGCELGQAMARLGCAVTILTRHHRLLPKEDPEISALVLQQFRSAGIAVVTGVTIDRVSSEAGRKQVWVNGTAFTGAEILLAIGRQANTESLGLEVAGIKLVNQYISVNDKLQTTNPRIFACGDVIGGYQFTHAAGQEAVTVVQNALLLPITTIDYRVMPRATFIDPEVASVGLLEEEAKQKYNDVWVLKKEYRQVDRAQTEGAIIGFAKIICRRHGEILGAHLVGTSAGELIHEIVLAMRYKLKVSALTGIHIYPTLAELNSKTALELSKQKFSNNQSGQKILSAIFSLLRNMR